LVVRHDECLIDVQGIKDVVKKLGFGALEEGDKVETREET